MNFDLYKSFYFIANNGSISKAAEQLYITQPALSRTIKQLEDELGCSLFTRTPKGVMLTQEGKILYEYIDKAYSFISAAEKKIENVKNLLSGEVKIGTSDTLCKHYLIPYLKLFKTLHPQIKIHISCQTTPEIANLLKAGKLDFGLINMPYNDDQLDFKRIMEVQDCFVAGEKYKYLSGQMHHIDEIIQYPLLLLERDSNSRIFIDEYFEKNSVSAAPGFELGTMDLLVRLAEFDFGIACVTRNFIEDELEKHRLYEIKPIESIPPRSIGVAWLKSLPLSKASSELINLLDFNDTSEI